MDNNIYIFNNYYKLRDDLDAIVITNNDSRFADTTGRGMQEKYSNGFVWEIDTYMAFLISYFTGEYKLKEIIEKICIDFHKDYDEIYNSIIKLIYNEEVIYYDSDNGKLGLPINLLVENKNSIYRKDIIDNIDVDSILKNTTKHKDSRLNIPNELAILFDTKCYTNCIYCFVDKRHKIENFMSFEKIKSIIKEARSLNMRDCQIHGGDLFCYPHWKELLQTLLENNYMPYVSTKYPLNEKDIMDLKELGVERIQFSLDSIDEDQLMKILKVNKGYLKKVDDMFHCLRKYGIKFFVKSVITKYNDKIKDVKNLIDYLLTFDNMIDLSIAPGASNLHSDFNQYRTSLENFNMIVNYVKELNDVRVDTQGITQPVSKDLSFEEKCKAFFKGARCSGNTSSFLILPDGKVTLCEQTYWHPNLILGDITNKSILEIWNSEKAISLYNINKENMNDENPCKKCEQFEYCRKIKGVCWRIAFQSYGYDKYDYPTPNCPYAPEVSNDIYLR